MIPSPAPNAFYIGTSKAGSTWLATLLQRHPDAFVPPAKDIYFWDRFFDRGIDWYVNLFSGGEGHAVRADISHDYMYDECAIARLHEYFPDARLIVHLREPADRALSTFQFLRRNGQVGSEFWKAVERYPAVVRHGFYAQPLGNVLGRFDRSRVLVGVFDDLRSDPTTHAARVCTHLDLDASCLEGIIPGREQAASAARSATAARTVKFLAETAREAGYPNLVGRVKRSRIVGRALYRPVHANDGMDEPLEAVRARLHGMFRDDVAETQELIGRDLQSLWGYT